MNHPSQEWIDFATYEVKEECDLDRHIRFKGLKQRDADDYEKCLRWEFNRSNIFKGEPYDQKDPIWFPFYVSSFPEDSYLSHDYKTRSSWTYFEGVVDDSDDLFKQDHGTNYEVDLGFYKGKIFRERVPITLQIDPRWNSEKLISLIRRQSEAIFQKVELGKKEIEDEGYPFYEKTRESKPISTLKKHLKALGHYRIGECMNLGWKLERFEKIYGKDTYQTEKIYRENILKYVKF
jgi:hypothetical protein